MSSPALKIIRYPDLERWDVKYFLAELDCKYPLVPLGELVEEHNEKVKPRKEPNKVFKILGVNNTGGIFHAYDSPGRKIKQPYKKVNSGDFAYNPYRINVGSIGIVPPEHDGAYISPAYVVFRVNSEKLLPKLLLFILKGEFFNESLRAATAGSVRMNLTYDLLKTLKVPLPPIAVQEDVAEQLQAALCEQKMHMHALTDEQSSFIQQFAQCLSLRIPKQQAGSKVFPTRWRQFSRWSLNFNQAARMKMNLASGHFPVVAMDDILTRIQYGSSEKANSCGRGLPVLRINNIKDGKLDTSELKHLELKKAAAAGLILEPGDILLIRTSGSRDLVGTCAVFHESGKYVFASYLIRLCVDRTIANPAAA